jgi:hypothetical protein
MLFGSETLLGGSAVPSAVNADVERRNTTKGVTASGDFIVSLIR